ncbi:hypothetical protein QOZ98_002291 [Planomicrobium stackebrandtii]|uniref:Uncharacterized protein n=1 Tax=Planomicrobium stackebrandtii TaxID=253160 RepID=A0ABU0GVW6_9BACL|nr:hypothetical protein [Planomicrobium stackebrandtii]MDQ0429463.1 hypothetical protein [Planomicrobium stackebrandtii]
MSKVYIIPETIRSDGEMFLCDNVQNLVKFYMGPSESANDPDSDSTCEMLIDFICTKALFPIFLTFEPFSGMEKDLERLSQRNNIEYTLRFEGLKNKRFPVFKLTIETPSSLTYVLQETFGIASSNNFYAFSFSDNIVYKPVIYKSWFGREKTWIWPHFDMNGASTVMEIWNDGNGFNLYTTESHFSTIEKLAKYFPPRTWIVKNED